MHVEAEIHEAEAARKTGAGAVRAADKLRKRLTAAETAIEEAETDRNTAQQLAKDLAARQDAGPSPDGSMYVRIPHWEYDLMRQQEQRAQTAERRNAELHDALGLAPGQLHSAALSAIRGRGENIRELTARAEQAEKRAADLPDPETLWPRVFTEALTDARAVAAHAEQRANRYRTAWKTARTRANEKRFLLAEARDHASTNEIRAIAAETDLRHSERARDQLRRDRDDARERAAEYSRQRDKAREYRNKWARQTDDDINEHRARADRYRKAWRSAFTRATGHRSEEKRVRDWVTHWNTRAVIAEQELTCARNAPTTPKPTRTGNASTPSRHRSGSTR
ncbi:hypothetical protein E4K10_18125 [Streptomyces sp. T1317-0309]|nr:hypothetical protein E4K10_18125 [Streptomyces sp. T1317-0309]